MTNKQIQIELDKIVKDINTILIDKQCKAVGQHEFIPLLMGFRPNTSQMTVFRSGVIMVGNVYVDKSEKHQKAIIINRTISACDYMIDTLKIYVDKLKGMLAERE